MTKVDLSRRYRIALAAGLYCIAAVLIYLFFQNIAVTLASQKLVTSQLFIVLPAIAIPLILFSLSVYCLTLALIVHRSVIGIGLIAIFFCLGRRVDVLTLASGVIVLTALYAYYKLFFNNLSDLKRPRISKAAQNSFGLFLMLMSVAMAMSFYQVYANRASRVTTSVVSVVSKHFNSITAAISDEGRAEPETFRSHAEHYVRARNLPVTEATVTGHMQAVSLKLGVPARPSEPYQDVVNRAINRQVSLTLQNYRVLLAILVPLAFFFITQTYTSVASYVIFGLLLVTELVVTKTTSLSWLTWKDQSAPKR